MPENAKGVPTTSFALFALKALVGLSLFYIPIHLRDMRFSGWEIGFLMGIDSLTALVATLPMGISSDLVSPRRLIGVSFVSLVGAFSLFASARRLWVFAVAFLLLGVFHGLAVVSLRALMFKTADETRRGSRLALISFAEHGGGATGSLLGGLLLAAVAYSTVFRATAVLFAAVVPIVFFLPRTATHVFEAAVYRRDFLRRDVVYFAIVTLLYAYHWGAEKTVYTLFLKESLGLGHGQMGIFVGVTIGALAVSSLLYGRLLDMQVASLRKLFVAGLILSSGGHLLMALSATAAQAFVFRTLHELGDSSFLVFSYVMTSTLFARSRIGGGSGFVAQIAVIATFLGALGSGVLLDAFGPRGPMIVASAVAIAALAFVGGLKSEAHSR